MELRWLCFADLHLKFKNFDTNQLRDNLKKYLTQLSLKSDFVLIAGDIAYKGIIDKQTEEFIKSILQLSECSEDNLFITPGNHDLMRSDDRNTLVLKCISESKQNNSMTISTQRFSYLIADFTPFKEIKKIFDKENEIDYCSLVEREKFRILNINSSLLCCGENDKENLFACSEMLSEICCKIKNDEKLNIAFMHHGVGWLEQKESKKLQCLLEDCYVDIVFTGHNHLIGVETYDNTHKALKQMTCGGTISDNFNEPSFFECIFNSDENIIKCILHKYSFSTNNWHIADNSLRAFNNGIITENVDRMNLYPISTSTSCSNKGNIIEDLNDQILLNIISRLSSFNNINKSNELTAYTLNDNQYENYIFENNKYYFSKEYQDNEIISLSDRIFIKFKNHYLFNRISLITFDENLPDWDIVYIWMKLLNYLIAINSCVDVSSWNITTDNNLKYLQGLNCDVCTEEVIDEIIVKNKKNVYLYFIQENYQELFSISANFIFENLNIEPEKIVDLKMTNDKISLLNRNFVGLEEIIMIIKTKLLNSKNDYTMIYADEGYGKTALVSKLICEINNRYFPFNMGKSTYEFIWLPKVIIIDGKRAFNVKQAINLLIIQAKFLLNKNIQYNDTITKSANIYLLFEQLSKELGKCIIIFDAIDEFSKSLDFLPDLLPLGINVLLTSRRNINSSIIKRENSYELRGLNKNEIRLMFAYEDNLIDDVFLDKVLKQTNGCPLFVSEIAKEIVKENFNIKNVKIIDSLERLFIKKREIWGSNILLERILELLVIYEPICNLSLNSIQGYLRHSTSNIAVTSYFIEVEIDKVLDQVELGEQKNYKIRYKAFYDYMMNFGYTNWDLKDIFDRIIAWFSKDYTIKTALIKKMYLYWKTNKKNEMYDLDQIIDILILREGNLSISNIAEALIGEKKEDYNVIIEKMLNYLLEKNEKSGKAFSYNYLLRKKDETLNKKAYDYLSDLALEDEQAKLIYANILLNGNKYIKKDSIKGIELLEELVEVEYTDAYLVLAIELLEDKPEESKKYALKGADRGHTEAMTFLARQLCSGEFYELDIKESIYWFERAIHLKDTKAMALYGIEKLTGEKLEKDLIGAESILKVGVELEDKECISLLGKYYLEESVSSEKSIEGELLLRKAIDNNNVQAMIFLGELLIKGRTLKQNINEGYELLEKACQLGGNSDKCYISKALLEFRQDKKFVNKSYELQYELADSGCCADIQYRLSMNLISGIGTLKNIDSGLIYLEKAIDSGCIDAILFMGILKVLGDFVDFELEVGVNMIKDVALKGQFNAVSIINQINDEKVLINNENKNIIENIICRQFSNAFISFMNLLVEEEKILRAAEIYEMVIDNSESKTDYYINFAYLIRKGKYRPRNSIYTLDYLLGNLVNENNSLAIMNYALYKFEISNIDFWEESLKLVECMDIKDEFFEDVIIWWEKLLKKGDSEGGLVLLWLTYFKKFKFDLKTNLKDVFELVKSHHFIPENFIEKIVIE